MLSHSGLLTNVEQLIAGMKLSASDCFVSWLPVYHDMGLIPATMAPFFLGAKLVLLPTALANARSWLGAVSRHRGTVTAAPDFAYRLRCAASATQPLTTSPVSASHSTPLSPCARALSKDSSAPSAYATYSSPATGWPKPPSASVPGRRVVPPLVDGRGVVSVGHPFPPIDVRIIENEQPLASGQIGEIVIHSPANTRGYFSDPAETARLFWSDAYIRTGDLGYLDDVGLLRYGRLKSIIKHGGETIFPRRPSRSSTSCRSSGVVRRLVSMRVDPKASNSGCSRS